MSNPITFPSLKQFLDDYLGDLDKASISYINALIIQAADPNEELCHVQLEDLTEYNTSDYGSAHQASSTSKTLNNPIIWWKKSWNIWYPAYTKRKQDDLEQRRRNNIQSENIDRIAKKLAAITTCSKESMRPAAFTMLKNCPQAAKELGVKLEE